MMFLKLEQHKVLLIHLILVMNLIKIALVQQNTLLIIIVVMIVEVVIVVVVHTLVVVLLVVVVVEAVGVVEVVNLINHFY